MTESFRHDAQRILRLAAPVWIGQLAVIAYGVIDTAMIARLSAHELAALAVGSAAYVTVFVGLQGIVQALSPIVGQSYGAQRYQDVGQVWREAAWLALGVSLLAISLLLWTAPWLVLTRADPVLADTVSRYLQGLAYAVPAAVGFRLFASLNTALARPHITMRIQLAGLVFKIVLNAWFIFYLGWGVVGCAWATALVMWGMLGVALTWLKFDPFYRPFQLGRTDRWRPTWTHQQALLRLGLPLGAAYLIEVSGFTFMALFIARLGTTPVAGHQIAANLSTVLFMTPLALGQAASALVAQTIGAHRLQEARRLGWHGIQLATGLAFVMAMLLWLLREPVIAAYTDEPMIQQAALSLLALSLSYHVFDSCQTVTAFILRAYKVAILPMWIYAFSVWGLGLGLGYWLAFNVNGYVPQVWQGPQGFWWANIMGLALASWWLYWTLQRVSRAQLQTPVQSQRYKT